MARRENWSPSGRPRLPAKKRGEAEDVAFAEITDGALAVIVFAAEPRKAAADENQSVGIIAFVRDYRFLGETLLSGGFPHRAIGSVPLEVAVALEQGVGRDLLQILIGNIVEQGRFAQMRAEATLAIKPVDVRLPFRRVFANLAQALPAQLEQFGRPLRDRRRRARRAGKRRDLTEKLARPEAGGAIFLQHAGHVLEENAHFVARRLPRLDGGGVGRAGDFAGGIIAHFGIRRTRPELGEGGEKAFLLRGTSSENFRGERIEHDPDMTAAE